jgi:hypothetical protein
MGDDAAMAEAGDAPAVVRGSAPVKKGKVDYAALEAEVQAQLQAASQARARAARSGGCRSRSEAALRARAIEAQP